MKIFSYIHHLNILTKRIQDLIILTPKIYKYNNSKNESYEVNRVNSIKNALKNNDDIKNLNKVTTEVNTIDNFVWNKCLSKNIKVSSSNIEIEKYFVDQEIFKKSVDKELISNGFSLKYIENIIDNSSDTTPIHIMSGDAGVGKTTFCETLVNKINYKDDKFSILISSADLKDATSYSEINTISDLYKFHAQSINSDATNIIESINLEINISCGNIILIIDGLDEIESMLQERFNLDKFISSVVKINEAYNNCKIIITTRNYNIKRFDQFTSLSMYELKGFTSEIADKYFKKRFSKDTDNSYIAEARKYLIKHGLNTHTHYIPFYISLICDFVERKKSSKENTNTVPKGSIEGSEYFNSSFLIDTLIYDILEREIDKQTIEISCDEYFDLLKEVTVLNKGRISITSFNEFISIMYPHITPTSTEELNKYKQFYVSSFLITNSDKTLSISNDYLETWIKSRYLFKELMSKTYNGYMRDYLSEMYRGKSPLLSEMLDLQKNTQIDLIEIGKYIVKQIHADIQKYENDKRAIISCKHAISGLLYYVFTSKKPLDQNEISDLITEIYSSSTIYRLYIFGDFFPINFSKLTVYESEFDGFTNLHKCNLPDNRTVFYYSTFKNIGSVIKQTFNKKLFDTTCVLDDDFSKLFISSLDASKMLQEQGLSDLIKVLKVGFNSGRFHWKSELIYRNITLNCNISISQFIDFLCEENVLTKEKETSGRLFGYLVSKEYQSSSKYLITNRKLKTDLENILSIMIEKF